MQVKYGGLDKLGVENLLLQFEKSYFLFKKSENIITLTQAINDLAAEKFSDIASIVSVHNSLRCKRDLTLYGSFNHGDVLPYTLNVDDEDVFFCNSLFTDYRVALSVLSQSSNDNVNPHQIMMDLGNWTEYKPVRELQERLYDFITNHQ